MDIVEDAYSVYWCCSGPTWLVKEVEGWMQTLNSAFPMWIPSFCEAVSQLGSGSVGENPGLRRASVSCFVCLLCMLKR